MRSTFTGLETALRGLQAQQSAIDITNHNIANANTPGYSRQEAVLVTTPPYTVPSSFRSTRAGQVGTGVTVDLISRRRDALLDGQFRADTGQLNDVQARSTVYRQLETTLGEPNGNGLNPLLDGFWNSWQSLVNNPDNLSIRGFTVSRATSLATAINSTRRQIESQMTDVARGIETQVGQVNDLARQIAALNEQIGQVLAAGQQPNDLADARDRLLDQLAGFIDITTAPGGNGATSVFVNGQPLVADSRAFTINTVTDINGNISLEWTQGGIALSPSTGSLFGLIDMHDRVLGDALTDIEAIRDTIAAQVNALHQTGYGLNDPAGPPPGRDFFEVQPNGDLRVLPAIVSDPSLIAASSGAGLPGNADVARQINGLRSSLTMSGNTVSIGEYYNAMISRIGSEASTNATLESNRGTLVQNIDSQRQQVSGVSLDEEVTNLVKFQRAYQASARVMTTVDEMLNTILAMGVAGR